VIEYGSAFVVGLFVFQALMMRDMYGGDYLLAVRKTFFAETVSMNAVMVGMIPLMVVLMHHVAGARDPLRPEFWFVMGMATIAGGITAFPINWWLVRSGLKHGCMTLPGRDRPAPALGHASMDNAMRDDAMPDDAMPGHAMHHMEMRELPLLRAALWVAGTLAAMLAAAWLASLFVPINFTRA
jgi:hypothetical protein